MPARRRCIGRPRRGTGERGVSAGCACGRRTPTAHRIRSGGHEVRPSLGRATTDSERQPGDRLAVGVSQARHGALPDAFAKSADDFNLLVAREDIYGANPRVWGLARHHSGRREQIALYRSGGQIPGWVIRDWRRSYGVGPTCDPGLRIERRFLTCKGGCPTTRRTGNFKEIKGLLLIFGLMGSPLFPNITFLLYTRSMGKTLKKEHFCDT